MRIITFLKMENCKLKIGVPTKSSDSVRVFFLLKIISLVHSLKIVNCKLKIGVPTFLFALFLIPFSLYLIPVPAYAGILAKPPNNLGLTGYWSLNEGAGTVYGDASGGGNSGTVAGAPTWIDGKRGKALSFDGSDDHFTATDTSSLKSGNSWTISAWINLRSSTGGYDAIVVGKQGWHGGLIAVPNVIRLAIAEGSAGASDLISYTTEYGVWHHYIATFTTGTNAMELFVDGVSAGTNTFNEGTMVNYGDTLYVGGSGDVNYHPEVYVDDVRIYNRALTAAEARALYESGASRLSSSQNSLMTNGLINFWSFNGANISSGTIVDHIGGNTGTTSQISTSTFYTAGKVGQGLEFTATSMVNLPTVISLSHTANWSISVWAKTTNAGTLYIMTHQSGNPVTNAIRVVSGKINYYHYNGAWNSESGSATVNDGNWHLLTWVNNGDSTLDMYVDGVLDADNVASNNSGPLNRIGNSWAGDSGFVGTLDEFRIYNRSLSASEVKQLYNMGAGKMNASQNNRATSGLIGLWSFNGPDISNGVALDRSGQGNNGYLTNIATSTFYDAGKVGQAFNFDGTDDYVNIGNVSALNFERTDSFSVGVWVKTADTTTGREILGNGAYSQSGWSVINIDTNQVRFALANSATNRVVIDANPPASYYTGSWTHIVFTYDGTSLASGVKSYMNGALVTQDTVTDALSSSIQTANSFRIGYGYHTSNVFNGSLDEVRIYNRVLTAAEVKQLYDMGK